MIQFTPTCQEHLAQYLLLQEMSRDQLLEAYLKLDEQYRLMEPLSMLSGDNQAVAGQRTVFFITGDQIIRASTDGNYTVIRPNDDTAESVVVSVTSGPVTFGVPPSRIYHSKEAAQQYLDEEMKDKADG